MESTATFPSPANPASDVYEELERLLPPVVARTSVPKLLGGLISVGRLANLDSEGRGPRRIKLGRKTGYLRSDLIAWMRQRAGQGA